MRWIGILLVVALLASGVFAADAPKTDKPDARLDKKVTISVVDAKLEDVATQLTEQSGVEIKAGTGERDWKVRERRVTIDAKDVRLGALMDEISKLLGFYVSKSGKEGEWAYTYWQDMKARLLESEMLNAEKEAQAQRAVKLRQSALDTAAEALKLSPEEAMKKRGEDPWTAYLGGTKAGRAYGELLAYIGDNLAVERDLILRGRKVTVDLSDFPPDLLERAKETLRGGMFGGAMQEMSDAIDSEYKEMMQNAFPSKLEFSPMDEYSSDRQMGMMGFGGMVTLTGSVTEGIDPDTGDTLQGDLPMNIFPFTDSKSAMGKVFGMMLLATAEGKDITDLFSETEDQSFLESMARESKTEKEPPTDPELLKEINIEGMPNVMETTDGPPADMSKLAGKVVGAISKATGKSILLESFPEELPWWVFVKPGKQPFYHLLVALEKAGQQWTLGDAALRVRPEDWALLRSFAISESLLDKYRGILVRNGEFTLDDIAGMFSELTDEQIDNTLVKVKDLEMLTYTVALNSGSTRDFLRLYGSFSAGQKSAALSEQRLAFGSLTGPQWDRLNAIINDELGGVYVVDGSITLRKQEGEVLGGEETDDHWYHFDISVTVSGEEEPQEFSESVTIYSKAHWENMKKQSAEFAAEAKKDSTTQPDPVPDQQ